MIYNWLFSAKPAILILFYGSFVYNKSIVYFEDGKIIYEHMTVVYTEQFGRMLLLGGMVMITKDIIEQDD